MKNDLDMFHADLNSTSHQGITDYGADSEGQDGNENFVAFKSSSCADLITAKHVAKAHRFEDKR